METQQIRRNYSDGSYSVYETAKNGNLIERIHNRVNQVVKIVVHLKMKEEEEKND